MTYYFDQTRSHNKPIVFAKIHLSHSKEGKRCMHAHHMIIQVIRSIALVFR